MAIPLFLFMGGAVDFARYTRYKADLANAVDAAALALARQPGDLDRGRGDRLRDELRQLVPDGGRPVLRARAIDVEKLGNGYRVSAQGTVEAKFLPVANLASSASTSTCWRST